MGPVHPVRLFDQQPHSRFVLKTFEMPAEILESLELYPSENYRLFRVPVPQKYLVDVEARSPSSRSFTRPRAPTGLRSVATTIRSESRTICSRDRTRSRAATIASQERTRATDTSASLNHMVPPIPQKQYLNEQPSLTVSSAGPTTRACEGDGSLVASAPRRATKMTAVGVRCSAC
jgi:hypothetical protein